VFYLILAPMMGVAYVSRDLTRRVPLATFAATRPLSDLELAFAKLRLSLSSYLSSLAIVYAVIAIIMWTCDNTALNALWLRLTSQLGTIGSCLGLLLLFGSVSATSWAAGALFMSLQLFYEAMDRKKHGWKISIAMVTLFVLLLGLARRAYEARDSALRWLQSAPLAVVIPALLLSAIALVLLPYFRRVASLRTLGTWAIGFVAVTVLGLAVLSRLNLAPGYRWALSSGLVSVALLTFMPLLLMPILVGMIRHR
jgi:hypothetical protein